MHHTRPSLECALVLAVGIGSTIALTTQTPTAISTPPTGQPTSPTTAPGDPPTSPTHPLRGSPTAPVRPPRRWPPPAPSWPASSA